MEVSSTSIKETYCPSCSECDGRKASWAVTSEISSAEELPLPKPNSSQSSAHPTLSDEEVQSIKPGHISLWSAVFSSTLVLVTRGSDYSMALYFTSLQDTSFLPPFCTLNFVSTSDFQKIQPLTSYKYNLT